MNKYGNYQSQQERVTDENDTEPGESDVDDADMYRIQNAEFNNQCCVCFRTYEEDHLNKQGCNGSVCVQKMGP